MSIKVKIGNYNIESEEGFTTEKEAVQFVKERFPELDLGLIKRKIQPLINKNADKSRNILEESTEGEESVRKIDSKRSERSETRKG